MRKSVPATGALLVVLLGFSAPALAHRHTDFGVGESEVDGLSPGEFIWRPEIEPHGPLSVVISLPAARSDEVLPILDRWAPLMRQFAD